MIKRPYLKFLLLAMALGAITIYEIDHRSRDQEQVEFRQAVNTNLRHGRMRGKARMISEFLNEYQAEMGRFPTPEDGQTGKTIHALVHDIESTSTLEKSSSIDWWLRNYDANQGLWYDPYSHYDPPRLHEEDPFRYVSNGEAYCLVAQGPDREISVDLVSKITAAVLEGDYALAGRLCESNFYDPTNGVISGGDIYVTSDALGFPFSGLTSRLFPRGNDRSED